MPFVYFHFIKNQIERQNFVIHILDLYGILCDRAIIWYIELFLKYDKNEDDTDIELQNILIQSVECKGLYTRSQKQNRRIS